jgi:peroxiredoxin (alkyl hydroperoxide reductase subunit C)
MKAYQADIAKFTDAETQIFGISVDSVPALKRWSEDLAPETKGLSFPLLSDFKQRKTVKDYGVFNEAQGFGMRATFVVDKEGIIRHVEEGGTAIDPSAAFQACNMLKKK